MADKPEISAKAIEILSGIFRTLSDRTRLQIVLELTQRSMGVGALREALSLPQHTVSHHLTILWMAGIVYRERDGNRRVYFYRPEIFEDYIRQFVSRLTDKSAKRRAKRGSAATEKSEVLDEAVCPLHHAFYVLGDKTRLRIVLELARHSMSVGALREALSLPQHTVSHHLAILWMYSVLYRHREGRQVIYVINQKVLDDLIRKLVDFFGGEAASKDSG